jgi:hypothetical protein
MQRDQRQHRSRNFEAGHRQVLLVDSKLLAGNLGAPGRQGRRVGARLVGD